MYAGISPDAARARRAPFVVLYRLRGLCAKMVKQEVLETDARAGIDKTETDVQIVGFRCAQ